MNKRYLQVADVVALILAVTAVSGASVKTREAQTVTALSALTPV